MKSWVLGLAILCFPGCVGYTVYTGCLAIKSTVKIKDPGDVSCYMAAELTLLEGKIYTPKKREGKVAKKKAQQRQLSNSGQQNVARHH